jgi:hypothetical protein
MKVQERPDGSWSLSHLNGRCTHNHQAYDASAYSENRRLDEAALRTISTNHAANIPASQTQEALHATLKAQGLDCNIISRDIYNANAKIRREERRGKPPNVALIEKLQALKDAGELFFEYSTNLDTHRIEKMFIADAQ